MIARIWNGETPRDKADAYVTHLRDNIFPELQQLPGHAGAFVLRRPHAGGVAFTVISLWQSIDAIRAFAGDDVEAAVVPPEARALLSAFDDRAVHWDVALAKLVGALDNTGSRGAK